VTDSNAYGAIEAVWRIESAKLIAVLTRMVRDVGLAKGFAQEALVAALERWPKTGIPEKPGAWLMTTAKNRALDLLRRKSMLERKHNELGREMDDRMERSWKEFGEEMDDDIGDDLLRLVFISCHPVLHPEARIALTLRLLGGLTTQEIARAFLAPEPTIAQRIVRAKRTLSEANVPFEVPRGEELAERLPSVLEVLYLVFNEGYSATTGDVWVRPGLCEDALRLGRILAELTPQEPEVHGLISLMEIQASRLGARVGPTGEPILLLDQNRARWDHILIRRGLAALERAESLSPARSSYTLQAAIAACHARAKVAEETDWKRIAALYDELVRLTPSPIIELNRAVALSMAFGPAVGLELLDQLAAEPSLKKYHLLPSVRGDFLAKLGRFEEARHELELAASLTQNESERSLLLRRVASLSSSPSEA
jgi:RNA polymerase sigma factor (sigma-70 family)